MQSIRDFGKKCHPSIMKGFGTLGSIGMIRMIGTFEMRMSGIGMLVGLEVPIVKAQ
jgi:hypothetical protein